MGKKAKKSKAPAFLKKGASKAAKQGPSGRMRGTKGGGGY